MTETVEVKRDYCNKAIRTIVLVFGVLLSISGMFHGLFEVLQGNVRTESMMINAIGESHKFWLYGDEPAFTLIPNYMLTGVAAIVVSIIIIVWSVKFLDRKYSAHVFLLLFVLLLLVGGGVGQAVFFIVIWGFATRINKPLLCWNKVIPVSIRKVMSKLWRYLLFASSLMVSFALEIAVFGYVPGISDPDVISLVMLTSLGSGFLLMILAFVTGISFDLETR